MKKFKWSFIAVALIAICSAFATKSQVFDFKYEYLGDDGQGNYLVGLNVSDQTQGTPGDYDCDSEGDFCVVQTDTEAQGGKVPIFDSQLDEGDFIEPTE